MKSLLFVLCCFLLGGCTSVHEDNNYGFLPPPGMHEDAQDRNNTKYNLLDSYDGRSDPTSHIKIWGATY